MQIFNVQIKRINHNNQIEWHAVHPTNGPPYRMYSEQEAKEFAVKFYPTCIMGEDIRIHQTSY